MSRKRLTEEEREQRLKGRIKNAKRYIGIYGLFTQFDQLGERVDGNNRDLTSFFRAGLDRAMLDVMLFEKGHHDRESSMDWFCTSAFDQTCHNAGLEVATTFTTMQNVFNHYKDSKYGTEWQKPNLLTRVSIN